MKIYVASSWRNPYQPDVVKNLKSKGHEVYDFRNPEPGNTGFHWSQIDEDWEYWTPNEFVEGLKHPLADEGFKFDKDALDWAEACVLVLPCGKSAHLEAGYMAGQGKPVFIRLNRPVEPELMYKLATGGISESLELMPL